VPTEPFTRRRILTATGIAAAGIAVDALAIEPRWLDVTEHDVPVAKLPSSLEGFTIAHVTDAHLKAIGPVEEAIHAAVRTQNVQLVALTGDIIDTPRRLSVLRDFCAALRRPGLDAISTLGNWEHWGRIAPSALGKAYADVGVRLLVNESSISGGIRIHATDDSTAGEARIDAFRLNRGEADLLLTHSPALFDRFPKDFPGFSMALAGHTHGGQVRLGSALVPMLPEGSGRFVAGWYDAAQSRVYVSRGTGTSIVPVRFTCRPELPIFRLRRA
jgi:predicted MPP superfamily phosphohydrolase